MKITRRNLRKLIESFIFNEGLVDFEKHFENLTPEDWEMFNDLDPSDPGFQQQLQNWAENSDIEIEDFEEWDDAIADDLAGNIDVILQSMGGEMAMSIGVGDEDDWRDMLSDLGIGDVENLSDLHADYSSLDLQGAFDEFLSDTKDFDSGGEERCNLIIAGQGEDDGIYCDTHRSLKCSSISSGPNDPIGGWCYRWSDKNTGEPSNAPPGPAMVKKETAT